MRARWRAALIAGLVCASAGARADGRFQVDPTRVELSAGARTGALTVRNRGAAKLRLELSAQAWGEDVDGKEVLGAAPEVIVRPSLVEIEPGAVRTVRVAVTGAAAGRTERSYRLFLSELPDRNGPALGGQIRVLTRVSVPVFVAPAARRKDARVSAKVDGGHAVVTVENTGSVHAKLASVRVAAVSGAGAGPGGVHWVHEAAGWYVLPEASRRFAIDLGTDGCGDHEQIEVTGVDEDGTIWSSVGTCER